MTKSTPRKLRFSQHKRIYFQPHLAKLEKISPPINYSRCVFKTGAFPSAITNGTASKLCEFICACHSNARPTALSITTILYTHYVWSGAFSKFLPAELVSVTAAMICIRAELLQYYTA